LSDETECEIIGEKTGLEVKTNGWGVDDDDEKESEMANSN